VKRTEKIVVAVFCIIFVVILLATFLPDDPDYEFDHYKTDVDIEVRADGSVAVAETYNFRWSGISSGEMYISFPDEKVNALIGSSVSCIIDGTAADLVSYETGSQATYMGGSGMALYSYGMNALSGEWEMNAFYKRAASGEHTVVFQYELANVVGRYSDCVDFYYKVFTYFSDDLKDLTVTVTMPPGSTQTATRIFGHGDPNGYCEFAGGTANAVFKSSNLQAYTMFEIRVVNQQTELYSITPVRTDKTFGSILDEERKFREHTELVILLANIQMWLIVAMVSAALLLLVLTVKLLPRNKPNFNQPYLRELPSIKPNIAAQLGGYYKLARTGFGNRITATVLNLAVQKIIAIEAGAGKEIVFVSLNGDAPMTRFERGVYNMLFCTVKGQDDIRITLSQVKKAVAGGSADHIRLSEIDRQEFNAGSYVDDALGRRNSKWKIIPLIPLILTVPVIGIAAFIDFFDYIPAAIFISFIIAVLSAAVAERTSRPLTVKGEDERAKVLALKKFYTDMTLMKERRAMELPLWEQHLVYAAALGAADKVIKELDVRFAEPGMYGSSLNTLTYMYVLHSVGGLSQSISSINQASYTAFVRGGGGGSSGGGFSSGGGGGFTGGGGGGFGGGGGGHR